MTRRVSKKKDVICWWSGGVTSAVACNIAKEIYGLKRCRFIMIDTKNEDEDTYRFKKDCEKWYGKEIEIISAIGDKYDSIEDVWYDNLSLNVARGAICSSSLKKDVRVQFQRKNEYDYQVFGFDFSEVNRGINLKKNYAVAKPIFPLFLYGLSKKDCINIINDAGIEIPNMYKMGFHNNNCFGTGCVQGGVGYWQKMKEEHPDKFESMAKIEHELTDLKGKPVTMLKDQSKEAKDKVKETGDKTNQLVFLLPHKDYPNHKDISMMKGFKLENLSECNGFCGTQTKMFD